MLASASLMVTCACYSLIFCQQLYALKNPIETRFLTANDVFLCSLALTPRCFSSYDDMSLKRKVSCPLIRSKSLQLPPSDGKSFLFKPKHKDVSFSRLCEGCFCLSSALSCVLPYTLSLASFFLSPSCFLKTHPAMYVMYA